MGRGTRALRLQGRGRFEGVGSSLGAWEHMRAAHSVKRLAPSKQAIVGSARAVAVHATRSRASSRTRLRASSHFAAACSRSSAPLHSPCPGTNEQTTERQNDRTAECRLERSEKKKSYMRVHNRLVKLVELQAGACAGGAAAAAPPLLGPFPPF
jgi:hypothetical protein